MSPAPFPPAPGVGPALRQAREQRERSLLQVAQDLHIKPQYLQALEEERWDALPSPAHARGFLRTYAAYLGLDPDALLASSTEAAPASPPRPAAPAATPSASAPASPASTAPNPFQRLGETLRQHREALGFSVEDMEHLTHVKAHYLRALEEGRVDDLPSPVQGRGMLVHYARALHLDPEPLLLLFAEGLQARLQARARPRRGAWSGWWRNRFRQWSHVLLAGGGLLAVLLFLLWSTLQVLTVYARRAATPTTAALGVSVWTPVLPTPSLAPQPTPAVTLNVPPQASPVVSQSPVATTDAPVNVPTTLPPTAATPADAASAEQPPPPSPVHVVVQVRHRAWLRVVADGQEVFRARVAPGETFTFRAEERLELQTGDAAAVQLVYNRQGLGVLGRLGEPLVLIFTPQEMLTPTPLASPTPTVTPTPTATPTGPTPTPAGTATPSPTATPVLQPRP